MEASFWHRKWEKSEIGFHRAEVSALLIRYFDRLGVPKGGRVFLPLCGKTKDIGWLHGQGYRVLGAELSELAVQQLFEELGLQAQISKRGDLVRYRAEGIDVFVGDIFELTIEEAGEVDAIYDRAALVALPASTRILYTDHLKRLAKGAAQLLVCYEYDQTVAEGPPFAVLPAEVELHYGQGFQLTRLESEAVEGGAKGAARETVWLVLPRLGDR